MISIATTFFNRRAQFINTLTSLTRSEIKDFEVIAVDDGSDDSERIDDLPDTYKFLKVFRIDKQDKWYHNPCIPFNLAFSKCQGEKIIIQNPECTHLTDILKLTQEQLTDFNYLSFAVYSVDESTTINNISQLTDDKKVAFCKNGTNGWYNHGIYSPIGLHFCSAITRKNLKELNGFDERFAMGNAYDDNEFLHRIKIKGLEIKFINDGIAIHQFHPMFNYQRDNIQELELKNNLLYNQITLNENRMRANEHRSIFPIKIVGFSQLRNELSKGNLENWFKQMNEVCDYIYIFDQNSDDGSKEYYKKFANTIVIESPTNRFAEECLCKKQLLEKLLLEHPDTDWILWLDGDLILDRRLLKNNGELLKRLCAFCNFHKLDSCLFEHYNLWRSDIYYRIDDQYHSLNGGWCPLWKNIGNLSFNSTKGLHTRQHPFQLVNSLPTKFCVIHRGFATDYQIITKYDVYKANGQMGWALDRLLNETGLVVRELPKDLYPEWFIFTDEIDPTTKKSIKSIYNENKSQ